MDAGIRVPVPQLEHQLLLFLRQVLVGGRLPLQRRFQVLLLLRKLPEEEENVMADVMTSAATGGRCRAAGSARGGDLLKKSLTVVHPHPQVLVLLQDVDHLVLQAQVLLRLETAEEETLGSTPPPPGSERRRRRLPERPCSAASCSAPAAARSSSR